jgi:hypothetical protein
MTQHHNTPQHNRHKKGQSDRVWRVLYEREMCDDETLNEGEEGMTWMQMFRDTAAMPQFDPKLSSPNFVLSHDNRWIQRVGSGAYPKAISLRPIRFSTSFTLFCRKSTEFGFFSGPSAGNIKTNTNTNGQK